MVFLRKCVAASKGARSALIAISSFWLIACSSPRHAVIGVIPQIDGVDMWEAAHVGAEAAARNSGVNVYWNAPAREDDVEAQIDLVEQVIDRGFQGLILAPDQAMSLISPVRRALAHGIPVVIIGSPLPIPPGDGLSYIVNDDVTAGRMAAQRLAGLLHHRGTVAILGIDPDFMSIMTRDQSFEEYLADHDPSIRIVARKMGSFSIPQQQQVAETILRSNPGLDAIVDLMSAALEGTLATLSSMPDRRSVRVIAFDVSNLPVFDRYRNLDCIIQENTRLMGQEAVELIEAVRRGSAVPARIVLPPVMITRANSDAAEVRWMFWQDWTLGRWKWNSGR